MDAPVRAGHETEEESQTTHLIIDLRSDQAAWSGDEGPYAPET